ncbi:25632_t:CDS:2, partial [Gigaspora rosea]
WILEQTKLATGNLQPTTIFTDADSAMQKSDCHNVGFIEDDYEEPQILIDMALKDCYETSVVQNEELNSKKVFYGRGLGICKKVLNIAITNGSNKALENILQQFIDKQVLAQNKNSSEQELNQKNDNFSISNPHQHKGRGHPANKRFLIAIEGNKSKTASSSNQDETLELGSKKRNKC